MTWPPPVRFRAVQEARAPMFPVLLEVTVDAGATWHAMPVRNLTLHESVDDVPTADVGIYLEMNE